MKRVARILVRMVVAIVAAGIAGCGGPAPDDIAKECLEHLKKADFAAMREYATDDMVQWLDRADMKYGEVSKLIGEKFGKKMKKTYAKLKCESADVKSDDGKATVPVKINGQETPMHLVKVKGEWKIRRFEFPIL